jgi:hypothetical protein
MVEGGDMALRNFLVYRIVTGDDSYPHSGSFTIEIAGSVTIDDSNGSRDWEFGDATHTGASDVGDQDAVVSTVAEIDVGDTVDVRYKYTFSGSDGSNGTVYFLATNGANNYGPLMVSNTPLDPSVSYTFGTFNTDGAVAYNNLVTCFATGTMIETACGQTPVEIIRAGDLVATLDEGLQRVRWVGFRRLDAVDLDANPNLRPVRIEAGALGHGRPVRDLLVSPQHRVLVRARVVERMFATPETLVPAGKLVDMPGISIADDVVEVTYVHLLFDRHQVVFSEGAETESLHLGPQSLKALDSGALDEIAHLFPEVLSPDFLPGLARPVPERGRLARKLVERLQRNLHPVQ